METKVTSSQRSVPEEISQAHHYDEMTWDTNEENSKRSYLLLYAPLGDTISLLSIKNTWPHLILTATYGVWLSSQLCKWEARTEGEGTTQKPMSSMRVNWDPLPPTRSDLLVPRVHALKLRENEEIKDVPTSMNCGVRVPGAFSVFLLPPSSLPNLTKMAGITQLSFTKSQPHATHGSKLSEWQCRRETTLFSEDLSLLHERKGTHSRCLSSGRAPRSQRREGAEPEMGLRSTVMGVWTVPPRKVKQNKVGQLSTESVMGFWYQAALPLVTDHAEGRGGGASSYLSEVQEGCAD